MGLLSDEIAAASPSSEVGLKLYHIANTAALSQEQQLDT